MAPKKDKHGKRTKPTSPPPPPLWGASDIAGSPTESDISDFTTPRARDDDQPDTATRFGDVSSIGLISIAPPTPTSDLTDAGTPRTMENKPSSFTSDIPKIPDHLKHPQPVRALQQPVPLRAGTVQRDTGPREAVLSHDGIFLDIDPKKSSAKQTQQEDHILSAAMLFVFGALLGALMNGFSLLLGTLLHGKRRRNYVLGAMLGAVIQISIIVVVLAYAVPMTGPTGVFRS